MKHLRAAAVTGERRDDAWTRMRDRAARDQVAADTLERLRRIEHDRDTLARQRHASGSFYAAGAAAAPTLSVDG